MNHFKVNFFNRLYDFSLFCLSIYKIEVWHIFKICHYPPYNLLTVEFVTGIFGQVSSVSIPTDYRLDGPGSNPGGDEIFLPSRPDLGPCKMSTGSFPGVEAGGGWG